ncbi:MAG: hypothetical protein V3V01_02885, partial [Acidimicrobiales bacterium]
PGGDDLASAPAPSSTTPTEITTTIAPIPTTAAVVDETDPQNDSQTPQESDEPIALDPVPELTGHRALIAVSGPSQSIWHVDLGTGDATKIETPVHVNRVGEDEIHFLEDNRFILSTGPRTRFTLFQIDDDYSGGVEQLFSFGSVGLGAGERGLDRENHGLWTATRFGLTRWDYEGDQIQMRWNDPDRVFDLTPQVRGSSAVGLLLEAPTGGDFWVGEDGSVTRLPDGRIEMVVGPWVLLSQCDDSLNCEGAKLINLLTGTEVDLGNWRKFSYGCALGDDSRFAAVGTDLNARLSLVTYDGASAEVTHTDIASGALGCVELTQPTPDTYLMAFEKGVAVFTSDGTWLGSANTRPLGGDVAAVQPVETP